MAPARLSALAAVVAAVFLSAALPPSQGSGIVSLVGWLGVALLIAGLALGYRGAVAATAVAFVVRSALAAPFDVVLFPRLWAQALLIVFIIEMAGASFTFRTRPADPVLVLARGLMVSVAAAALVQALAVIVEGAEATGVLVRVAGVAAVVIAAGWVTRVWRRSGLSG
ncbi:MAG: hypothetical protein ACRDX9_12870 [Acidimicrobiia bacterium]